MRASLKKSLAHTPATGFERYPSGSIVLCQSCALPIFRLARAIDLGDKCGGLASAFVPVLARDLDTLAAREDIDAGVRGVLSTWTTEQRVTHVAKLREMRSGDPMLCPVCHGIFVQVVSVDRTEAIDAAYTVELVTIPPAGVRVPKIRGKRIGVNHEWIH